MGCNGYAGYPAIGRHRGNGGPVCRCGPQGSCGAGTGPGRDGRSRFAEHFFGRTFFGPAGLSPAVLAPVVKTSGIAILTRLAAELCRDAGESGIAAFVETAGAACALCAAVPLLETVLTMVTGLL